MKLQESIRFGHVRAAARRFVRAGVACLALTPLIAAGADPAPVADFFKPPEISELRMSPSGKYISALLVGADGRKRLAVLDPADLTKSKVIASAKDADVVDANWVNDERLVFSIYDRTDSLLHYRHAALLAVNASGNDTARYLVRPVWYASVTGTNIVDRSLPPNHGLRAVLRDGSNDVIVSEYVFDALGDLAHVNLKRLDTVTGLTRGISQGTPRGARDFALDVAGNPRAVYTSDGSKASLFWRAKAGAPWTLVQESDRSDGDVPTSPIFVDGNDRLFASARIGSEDHAVLTTVAMADGLDKAQVVLSAPGYDISPSVVTNGRGTVLGLHYLTDARASYWFDEGLRAIQGRVDTLLPGLINRLDCGQCERREKVLVGSQSDRQPETFSLFDVASGKLEPIMSSRPWIKANTMAQRDLLRFTARDGLSVPVHVTRPKNAKGVLPMVVLIHGGPFLRGGEWEWDAHSQFLASRGYLVIEPEFRGSVGFGYRHYREGWKQWGLKMQDDVADAAKWAVRQGHADPRRICIAGASYGGYATLMGLIRNPEIFRCGIQWAGVTDIDLMYSISWSDTSADFMKHTMPSRIGDPVKDADQLAATSPIRLADKVTQPLLMAYGGLDRRVPIEHGTRFRDAVGRTNKQVEWVAYADEGHGWSTLKTDVDFWTRVEKFLDKNLKHAP